MASGDHPCCTFMYWFLSVLVWGSIGFFIFGCVAGGDLITWGGVTFGVMMLIYFIVEFCSSSCSYLSNQRESADIYEYMKTLFYTPLHKIMHIQCYHYETHHYTDRDSNGNVTHRTEQVRVNTHFASEHYYYISWRDVSGKFDLDYSGASANQERPFVKLHLGLNMSPVNDGTIEDFQYQMNSFISRNNWDTHYDFSEHYEMAGYLEHNLIRVSDHKPACFSVGWFVLFTFLTMVEFYKLYMDKFCIVQEFTIVKAVSSRRDLNAPDYISQYSAQIPCIVLYGKVTTYDGPMILNPGELVKPDYSQQVPPNQGVPGQQPMAQPMAQPMPQPVPQPMPMGGSNAPYVPPY